MLHRRRAGADDAKVQLGDASDEDVEAVPGLVDVAAFDANEVESSYYSSADNTISS